MGRALQNWTVNHETAVYMHLSGKGIVEVAKDLGRSPSFVRGAVDSPQGQEIRSEFFRNLREKMKESISSSLLMLAQTSLLRIAQTLNQEDFEITGSAKRHQDRVGLRCIKTCP